MNYAVPWDRDYDDSGEPPPFRSDGLTLAQVARLAELDALLAKVETFLATERSLRQIDGLAGFVGEL